MRPDSEDHVTEVMKVVPPMVAAIIEIQWLGGCRPQDVVQMRACDIDMSGPVWEYRPPRYKTEHHNDDKAPDLDRVVYLGPTSQSVLKKWMPSDPNECIFSPRRSEKQRNELRRMGRKSPMSPSQASRKPLGRERAPLREHYDVCSYRRAVQRGCQKAGIPSWAPKQLRHSRLTAIRARFGLEASRVVGGHKEIGVTQSTQNRTAALLDK